MWQYQGGTQRRQCPQPFRCFRLSHYDAVAGLLQHCECEGILAGGRRDLLKAPVLDVRHNEAGGATPTEFTQTGKGQQASTIPNIT